MPHDDVRVIEGRCLCGASSFRAQATAQRAFVCHCKDCQRQTGSAFSSVVVIADDSFVSDGPIATFKHAGGSGSEVARSFCQRCGSALFSRLLTRPGQVYLKTGVLNDTSWLDPSMQIWCRSAQNWVPRLPEMDVYDMGIRR